MRPEARAVVAEALMEADNVIRTRLEGPPVSPSRTSPWRSWGLVMLSWRAFPTAHDTADLKGPSGGDASLGAREFPIQKQETDRGLEFQRLCKPGFLYWTKGIRRWASSTR